MEFFSKIRSAISVLTGLALVSGMISCTRTQPIPITTSSEKAMTHYMSALDAIDGYEVNKARTFFRKAIAADSNFAMAHLSLGTSIMDETERLKYFKKAKELKKYSSNGEQKLIDAYYTLMVDQDTNGFLQQMEKNRRRIPK